MVFRAFLPPKISISNKKGRGVCNHQLISLLFISLKSPLIAYMRRVYASISLFFCGVKIDQLTQKHPYYFCLMVDNTPHPLPFIYLETLVFLLIIIIFLLACESCIPLYYGIVSAFAQVHV